ncbi:3-4-dihydroxy-2-butanone 4-phosphate synthase [Pyrenophora tritici-repentis]|nr:3-4-dihydroxy-2-butanone 4-phosphate synthase [Pyrenophora tritici-repentis]
MAACWSVQAHTEAAVDISRMAGLTPAGVICEIIKGRRRNGRMPDLISFAQLHGLKIGTIADLIAYRRRTERFVERVMDTPFESVTAPVPPDATHAGADASGGLRLRPVGHVEARQDYVPNALKQITEHDGPAWSSSCATLR